MSPRQVGAEPLAGNPHVGAIRRAGAGPLSWAEALREWGPAATRVRDLRPTADGAIPAAVPAEWRAAVAAAPLPPAWSVSADGRWVRHAPPAGGAARMFIIDAEGRLLDPPPTTAPPADAVAQWTAACIVDTPLVKGRGPGAAAPLPPLREAPPAAHAPPPAGEAPAPPPARPPPEPPPRDLFLAGPWDQAPYDLLMWGHGSTPLAFLTVRQATLRLIRLRALALFPSTYVPHRAVLPALWGSGAAGTANPDAVQALARRQAAAFAAKVAAAARAGNGARGSRDRRPPPTDAELGAIYRQPWMQPSPARESPSDRAAQRRMAAGAQQRAAAGWDDTRDPLQPADAGADGQGWRAAWRGALGRDSRRHHRAFTWALLHTALPCSAAKVPFWPSDVDGIVAAACCGNAACRPGQPATDTAHVAGATLETLLHALFECPAVRPAIRWAAGLWARIEGEGPPLTPRVWLQGDPGAWQPQLEHNRQLWRTLRIALLSAAWALRCRRASRGTQFSPAEVVAACVEDLRAVVRADWQRATADITRLDGVSSRLFAGRREGHVGAAPHSVAAFEVKWCGGGVVAYVARWPGRPPALELRLGAPSGPLV